MKRAGTCVALGADRWRSPPRPALASEELAKKNACIACHTVDKKLVGPSYKDVAAKYRGDKGAAGEARARR